jgi:putative transcriptional regulator
MTAGFKDGRAAKCFSGLAAFALLFLLRSLGPPVLAADDELLSAGKLLVASNEMQDPRFFQAVIYLVKHDAEGTLGLIINRPLAKGPIDDLLKGLGVEQSGSQLEIVVHYGGPVSGSQGFLLHSDDKMLDTSLRSPNGIAMTSDARMIQTIAAGAGPRQFLFTLGYAGWAPGQLEEEIKANSWFLVTADKVLIFGTDAGEKWRRALDRRKIRL